ncbi:MAG: T9SS type A sorting domain-containing protein [Crocinitomicaceae bacterium]|nr:T9SS type A sorting domain-containing protein [Crocinitomicaceae bacterium]
MKVRLFLTSVLVMTTICHVAQSEYGTVPSKPNGSSSQASWVNNETFNSVQTKSSVLTDESGYFFNNAYVMTNGSGNYNVDPLKVWPNGATGTTAETFSQAEQFVPNTALMTLEEVSFLGMAMDPSASITAVVVIQDKSFNYITHEMVTVSTFNKYTAVLSNPVSLSDTFMIVVTPAASADSLYIGVTNDYGTTLPYQGHGYFVEYTTANQSYVNAFTPGDGGGDFIIWPKVSYNYGDVTSHATCLTSTPQLVSFTSPNAPVIYNPIWNYNAWAIAQGAPVSAGYYHTAFEVVEDVYNDTNQQVNFDYSFSTISNYTVNYTERVWPWTSTANMDNAFTFNISGLDLTNNSSVNASCIGCADGSATVSVSGGVAPYTYLWNDPSAQTTATASGLAAGSYSVLVSDANACSNSVSVVVSENNTASMNSNTSEKINIYPNPVSNFITIDSENATFIQIIDLLGRTVISKNISNNKKLDLTSLSNGTYLYNIRTSNETISGKIIVKK